MKMAQTRMQIHRSKRANENLSLRKQVSELLAKGKTESARIKVERVIQNDYFGEALELLDMYCDLVHSRVLLLDGPVQQIPPDLTEAVRTLVWAAPRTEVEELMKFRQKIAAKFGIPLIQDVDNNPAASVNARVLFKLSVVIPEQALVTQYLTGIAEEFDVDWQPELPPSKGVPNPYFDNGPSSGGPIGGHGVYVDPHGGPAREGKSPTNSAGSPPPPVLDGRSSSGASAPNNDQRVDGDDDDFDDLARRFESLKKK